MDRCRASLPLLEPVRETLAPAERTHPRPRRVSASGACAAGRAVALIVFHGGGATCPGYSGVVAAAVPGSEECHVVTGFDGDCPEIVALLGLANDEAEGHAEALDRERRD